MWRYLVGGVAALSLAGAGVFFFSSRGSAPEARPLLPPQPAPQTAPAAEEPLPEIPQASERTREEKRFDRYDRNHDNIITREEFLANRRKAFARLDTNGDGRLSFEEWAVKTIDKFALADKDKSGTLTRSEFATTAVKRKPSRPRCACPAPARAEADKPDTEEN